VERWYYEEMGDECAWAAGFRGAVPVCDSGLPLVSALILSAMRKGELEGPGRSRAEY
jgi:hypothetical protein